MMTVHTPTEIRAELDRQIIAAGGLLAWCRAKGLPHAPVSLACHGHRDITEQIATALGYIRVTGFVAAVGPR